MNVEPSPAKRPSADVEAQAAVWLARLYGPDRTPRVDRGFRRWLLASPEHSRAFEIATETWEKLGLVRRRPLERMADWERTGVRLTYGRAAAAVAAVMALTAVGTAFYQSRTNAISTAVGEQRAMTLEDGSRVVLNTDTFVHVEFDQEQRRLELRSGEAFFEVARHRDRPFIVVAGDREIRAIGTSFVVRRDGEGVVVTLVDGKVAVGPAIPGTAVSKLHPAQRLMSPGDRLSFRNGSQILDTPPLDKVTAWQRGQISFDDTPLPEALTEINRYNRVKIVMDRADSGAVKISGMFRTTEAAEFARAIAQTYSLRMTSTSDRIVLSGVPIVPRIDKPLR